MIKCAHCKNKHNTIADVRMCSKVAYAFSTSKSITSATQVISTPAAVVVIPKMTLPTVPKGASEPGMYQVGENVYKVDFSKNNMLYARKLTKVFKNGDLHKLVFVYAKGDIWKIKEEHRMTEAQVAELGKLTGHCWVCARQLKVKKSIEAGIGPVCIKKV